MADDPSFLHRPIHSGNQEELSMAEELRVDMMSLGDNEKAVYQAQRNHELELNRATGAFEHAVISPLFLLNGGLQSPSLHF
jgi:hypothetical protein